MSMTVTPTSSQMLKSHDCRARDIKRRLDVIQKKMTDLQELGVPCAFCYISVRNTGSLFTMGNKAMTRIIEESRDVILDNLSEIESTSPSKVGGGMDVSSIQKEIHMVLPPLPQPLDELNLHDLRGLIVGIVKDLGIKWSDKKPPFWPDTIPFQYPRTAPEGFQGCWTQALREIVRSMYIYFDYNPETYCKCSTPAAGITHSNARDIDSAPALDKNQFFPDEGSTSLSSAEPKPGPGYEPTTDEETEEIDVELPYPTTSSNNTSHSADSMIPRYEYMIEDDKHRREDDDDETISVCSDPEPTTVNYFGYEIARGESLQSSPNPAAATARQHLSDHEMSSDTPSTPSPKPPHPLVQAPQLLYCSPQLYSQLYPSIQATPFLLQPNLLMKSPFVYPSSSFDSTKVKELTKDNIASLKQSTPLGAGALMTSAVPYPLCSRPLQLSSLNLQSTNTSVTPLPITAYHQQLQLKGTTNEQLRTSHSAVLDSGTTAETTSPPSQLIAPSSHHQHETTKNKKGRNHGIYIYTTPTEPLKFMSLNNKKSTETRRMHSDKKLVAMAPVAPPPPLGIEGSGEAVIMRGDSESNAHLQQQNHRLVDSGIKDVKPHHPPPKNSRSLPILPSHNATSNPSPSAASTNNIGSRKSQGTMKRRRELVFHWYQSPENQPSTSPPSTKRMNTAGTV